MQPLYQAVEFQRSKARGRTYTGAIERFCKHFLERVSLTKSQSLVGVAGSKGSGFDNPWKGEGVVSQRLSACVLEYWSIGVLKSDTDPFFKKWAFCDNAGKPLVFLFLPVLHYSSTPTRQLQHVHGKAIRL